MSVRCTHTRVRARVHLHRAQTTRETSRAQPQNAIGTGWLADLFMLTLAHAARARTRTLTETYYNIKSCGFGPAFGVGAPATREAHRRTGAHARTHARRTHVPVATHYIIVIYNIAARLVRRMFVYAIHMILYIYLTGTRTAKGYGSVRTGFSVGHAKHTLGGT